MLTNQNNMNIKKKQYTDMEELSIEYYLISFSLNIACQIIYIYILCWGNTYEGRLF